MPAEEIEVPTLYDRALMLATLAHCRQVDYLRRPYVEHPMQVAAYAVEMMTEFEIWQDLVLDPNRAAVVGLLHDTIEDTWVTRHILNRMFPLSVGDDVMVLSDVRETPIHDPTRKREARDEYLQKILDAASAYPFLVKIADLRHNTRPDRLGAVREINYPKAQWLEGKYAADVVYMGLDESPFARFFDHLPVVQHPAEEAKRV